MNCNLNVHLRDKIRIDEMLWIFVVALFLAHKSLSEVPLYSFGCFHEAIERIVGDFSVMLILSYIEKSCFTLHIYGVN